MNPAEHPERPSAAAVWFAATRLPFLTASVVPVAIGTIVAARDGHFDAALFVLTLAGAALFHLGTNTANDYFDHVSGADEANRTPTPFSGGSRVIQRGLVPPKTMALASLSFYALGTLVGLELVRRLWPDGVHLLWLGGAGLAIGLLYTAPPARLAYRGAGELAVGVGFGPLVVLGAYFVQARAWSTTALLASLPVGFLIAAVLYINECPDKEGDARSGKRTLVVRLPERAAVAGYFVLLALAYGTILAGVARGVFPPYTLAALATVPLAVRASLLLGRHRRSPYDLVPANALTVMVHFATGMLFFAGYAVAIWKD